MINKKVFILTAAMVPMLGLADVGGMDCNRSPGKRYSQHSKKIQQKIKTVRALCENCNEDSASMQIAYDASNKTFAIDKYINGDSVQMQMAYDVSNETFTIDYKRYFSYGYDVKGEKCSLNEETPCFLGWDFEGVSFKDFIRACLPKEAETLGLYKDLSLNNQLPALFEKDRISYNYRFINRDKGNDNVRGNLKFDITWGDYFFKMSLLDHEYLKIALRLGLFAPEYLKTNIPDAFNMTFNGYSRETISDGKITWEDYWRLYFSNYGIVANYKCEEISLAELAKKLFGKVLSENISNTLVRWINLRAFKDDQENEKITWREYVCFKSPLVASLLNVYTKEFLRSIVPNAFTKNNGIYGNHEKLAGLNWKEFLSAQELQCYSDYNGYIYYMRNEIDKKFFKKHLPQQIVQMDILKYSGLTWREFYGIYNSDYLSIIGLNDEIFLDSKLSPAIVAKFPKYAECTWRMFYLMHNLWTVEKFNLYSDKLLNKFLKNKAPAKFLKANGFPSELTWKDCLYLINENAVLKFNINPKFTELTERDSAKRFPEHIKLRDYLRFYEKDVAQRLGLLTPDVFSQELPSSITEIDGNQTLRGLTWGDYYPHGIWFFRKIKIIKDFKDEF